MVHREASVVANFILDFFLTWAIFWAVAALLLFVGERVLVGMGQLPAEWLKPEPSQSQQASS
jgi:hypothetical protein